MICAKLIRLARVFTKRMPIKTRARISSFAVGVWSKRDPRSKTWISCVCHFVYWSFNPRGEK